MAEMIAQNHVNNPSSSKNVSGRFQPSRFLHMEVNMGNGARHVSISWSPQNLKRCGVTKARSVPIASLLIIVGFASLNLAAEKASLAGVLELAGRYVVDCQARMGSIIAEENSVQEITAFDKVYMSRKLRADVVVFVPAGTNEWMFFRDVFEVDGKLIHPRQTRMEELLEQGPSQLDQLTEESAQYNIGSIHRNFNNPIIALSFLLPKNQPRLHFKKKGVDTVDGISCWKIEAKEFVSPTLIQEGDKNKFTELLFWIDPTNGKITRTVLNVGGEDPRHARATIQVQFQANRELDLLLPIELSERYYFTPFTRSGQSIRPETLPYDRQPTAAHRVDITVGLSKYSNFRQVNSDIRSTGPVSD
jgi:hypothetical protein